MPLPIQMADVLTEYRSVLSKIPKKKQNVDIPSDFEERLKLSIDLQRGFELSCRISELFGRLKMIDEQDIQQKCVERLSFLITQLSQTLDGLDGGALDLVAFFQPYNFKGSVSYINKLADSRVGKKLQAFNEPANFFEVLTKLHNALRVIFLRSLLTLQGYPEADLSLIALKKIRTNTIIS